MDGSRLDGFVLSSRGRKRLPTQFLPTSMACRTPTGTPISPILRVFIHCALADLWLASCDSGVCMSSTCDRDVEYLQDRNGRTIIAVHDAQSSPS